MPGSHELDTLNRLLRIDWRTRDSARRPSQTALFHEYLRRVGVWCAALDWPEAHPVISDIPARINPDVTATPVNTTLIQQTMRTVGRTHVYERMMVTRVLNMAAVVDFEGDRLPYGMPNLYEPLLVFYERGGWVDRGAHGWLLSGVPFELERAVAYRDITPLNLYDDLDRLDATV